jgi:hypothetical protein
MLDEFSCLRASQTIALFTGVPCVYDVTMLRPPKLQMPIVCYCFCRYNQFHLRFWSLSDLNQVEINMQLHKNH